MRFYTVFFLTIVVYCTIKVHTAPLQKRDVETISQTGKSGIDNLKQQASNTFSKVLGKNNNSNQKNNVGKWVRDVTPLWPKQKKANNSGKSTIKNTSSKKQKEKTDQLDEDEMTGNLFEEAEIENGNVANTEQEDSEMPSDNKKNNSTKKKKRIARKTQTWVQNPLYYGALLGFPHENMDNEDIPIHTEVWKWNDSDGQEVVLMMLNDVNLKSSSQKSNSDNVFLREKRNFDDKNIPFIPDSVPKDYQHVNLNSEMQTHINNSEGINNEENTNYGNTKNLMGNNNHEKNNAQLKIKDEDGNITLPPKEQDSSIPPLELEETPKDLPLGENFFEFKKDRINDELTKIESITTPFSKLSNNNNESVFRKNKKKKIIKRLVPKINLTNPIEKNNVIENDDELSQNNFDNDDENNNSKKNMPTEHFTNDNRITNKIRNIKGNRNPGLQQLLQGNKISNGLENPKLFDKIDETTENSNKKEKSDGLTLDEIYDKPFLKLPSSSTKKEINDKLQNTNKEKLEKDELINNDLFSSDDFFGDGNIPGTDAGEDKDDKNNDNVTYLDKILDNPDEQNKLNNAKNEISRFELSTLESNELSKIPQIDIEQTDNHINNQHLQNTPQNDNTNKQNFIKLDEVEPKDNNYVPYFDETLNIPDESTILENLSQNQHKNPLLKLQSHVSNEVIKIPQADISQHKNKQKLINKPNNNQLQNNDYANKENMIIMNKDQPNNHDDYISYTNEILDKPNEQEKLDSLPLIDRTHPQFNSPKNDITNGDIKNSIPDNIEPMGNNNLVLNNMFDDDDFFIGDDTSDVEVKDKDPVPFIEETFDISGKNDKSHDLSFNGKSHPNFESSNYVPENPNHNDQTNKSVLNNNPDDIKPNENDVLPLDDLLSTDNKPKLEVNDKDTPPLKEEILFNPGEHGIANGLLFNEEPNLKIKLSNHVSKEEKKIKPQYGSNTKNDISNNSLYDIKAKENNDHSWSSWLGYSNIFGVKDDSKLGLNNKDPHPYLKQPLDRISKNSKLNGLPIYKEPTPIQINKDILNNNSDIKLMKNDVLPSDVLFTDEKSFGDNDKSDSEINGKDTIKLLEDSLNKHNGNSLPFNKEKNPNVASSNNILENPNHNAQKENSILNDYPEKIDSKINDVLSLNDLFGDDKSDLEDDNKGPVLIVEETLDNPDINDIPHDSSFNEQLVPNFEKQNPVSDEKNTEYPLPDDYLSKDNTNNYPEKIDSKINDVLSLNDLFGSDNLFGDDKSDLEDDNKGQVLIVEETLDNPDINDIPHDSSFNEQLVPNFEKQNPVSDEKNTEYPLPDDYLSKDNTNNYPEKIDSKINDVLSFNDLFGSDNLFGDDKSDLEDDNKGPVPIVDNPDINDIPHGSSFNEQLVPNFEKQNPVSDEKNTEYPLPDDYLSKDNTNNYPEKIDSKINDVLSLNDLFGSDNLFGDDKSDLEDDNKGLVPIVDNPDINYIPHGSSFNEQLVPNFEKQNPVSDEKNTEYPLPDDYLSKDNTNNYPEKIDSKINDVLSLNDLFGSDNLFGDDKSDLEDDNKGLVPIVEETLYNPDINDIPHGSSFNEQLVPNFEKQNPVSDEKNTEYPLPDDYLSKDNTNNYPEKIDSKINDVLSLNDLFGSDNLFGDDKSDLEDDNKGLVPIVEETLYNPDINDIPHGSSFNEQLVPNFEKQNPVSDEKNTEYPLPDDYLSKDNTNNYPEKIDSKINDVLSLNDLFGSDNLFGDDKSDLEDDNKGPVPIVDNPDINYIPHGSSFNEQLVPNFEKQNPVSDEKNTEYPLPDDYLSKDNTNNYPEKIDSKVNDVLSLNDLFGSDNLFGDDKSDLEDDNKGPVPIVDNPDINDIPHDSSFNEQLVPNFEKQNPVSDEKNTEYPLPDDYLSKDNTNNYPEKIDSKINDVLSLNDLFGSDNLFGDDKSDLEDDNKGPVPIVDNPDINYIPHGSSFNEQLVPNFEKQNPVSDEKNTEYPLPDDYLSNDNTNNYPEKIDSKINDVLSLNDLFGSDNLFGDDKSDLEDDNKGPVPIVDNPDINDIPHGLSFNEQLEPNFEKQNPVSDEKNTEYPLPDDYLSKDNTNNYPEKIDSKINDVLSLNDLFGSDNLFGDDKSDLEVDNKGPVPIVEETLDNPDINDIPHDSSFNEQLVPNFEKQNPVSDEKNTEYPLPDDYLSKDNTNNYPEKIDSKINDVLSLNDLFGDDKSDLEDDNKGPVPIVDNPDINDIPHGSSFNEQLVPNFEKQNPVSDEKNTEYPLPDDYLSKDNTNNYPEKIDSKVNDVLSLNDLFGSDNLFGDDKSDLEDDNKGPVPIVDNPDINDIPHGSSFNEQLVPNFEKQNPVSDEKNTEYPLPDDYLSKDNTNKYPEKIDSKINDVLSLNDLFGDDKSDLEDDNKGPVPIVDNPDINDIPHGLSFNEELVPNFEKPNPVSDEKYNEYIQLEDYSNKDLLNSNLGGMETLGNDILSLDDLNVEANDKDIDPFLSVTLDHPTNNNVGNSLLFEDDQNSRSNMLDSKLEHENSYVESIAELDKIGPLGVNEIIDDNSILKYNDDTGNLTEDSSFNIPNDHELKLNGFLKNKYFNVHESNDKKPNNVQVDKINKPKETVVQKTKLHNNGEFKEAGLSNEVLLDPLDEIRHNIQPNIIKKRPKNNQLNDVTDNNVFNLNLNSENIDDINYNLDNTKHSTKPIKPGSNININIAIKKPEPNHMNTSDKEYFSAEIDEKPKKKITPKNNNSLDLDLTHEDLSNLKQYPKSRKEPKKFYDNSPEDASNLRVEKNKKITPVTYENPNHTNVLQNTPPVINMSHESAPVQPTNLDSIINSSILDKYDLYPKDFWKFILNNPNIFNRGTNSNPNQNNNELLTNKDDKNSPNVNTVDIFDGINPKRHPINNPDGSFRPFMPNRYNNQLPTRRKSNKGKTNYFNINNYLSKPTPTEKNGVNSLPPVDFNTNLPSQDSLQNDFSKNNKANSNAPNDDSRKMKNMDNNDDQNQLYDSFFKALTDRLLNHIDTALDSKLSQQADNIRNNQNPDDNKEDSRKNYQIESQTLKNMKSSHNKKVITKNKIASKVDSESEENITSSEEYARNNNKRKTKIKTKKTKKHVSGDESDTDESVEDEYNKKKTKNNTGKSEKTKLTKKKTTKIKNSKKTNSQSLKKTNLKSKKSKVSTKKKTTKSKKKSKSPKRKSNKIKKVKKKSSSLSNKSKKNNMGLKNRKKKTNKNAVKKKKVTYYVNKDVSSPNSNEYTYVPNRKKVITRYVVREDPKTENAKYVIKRPKQEYITYSHHLKNKHRNKPDDPLYYDLGYLTPTAIGYYDYY